MKRVVVTGLGVVAPNGINVPEFRKAIESGKSGVRFSTELELLRSGCQVAGLPNFESNVLNEYFTSNTLRNLNSTGVQYGCAAAIEAWLDAGLQVGEQAVDLDAGCVFGSALPDLSFGSELISKAIASNGARIGTRYIEQIMGSGTGAYITGLLGLGNYSVSTSVACATGTEAILNAANRIRAGFAKRMLAGSNEATDAYTWFAFDGMGVTNKYSNHDADGASMPMSQHAKGFIPGAGAGALILEDLEVALARGARIYAEIKGGWTSSGGGRNGGTMTANSFEGMVWCIKRAMLDAEVEPGDIDLICGHLTSTKGDVKEVQAWAEALGRRGSEFPVINSLKSMIGHCLGAAGSIECVAAVLQLHHSFIHPSINCQLPHQEIIDLIDEQRIPQHILKCQMKVVAKANFGFGDVSSCIFFSGI
ncbi:beta-ketoacyl-[acyl-carrier-protein] synthase family protein [Dyadobacter sp. OTU695]|uniref:beta-ketoacyl-[acyl-carrier-protein] synthase family protein n=1 Tax=Dyadobacter sp. OTU695 TaxID=3043860 RepID=UPI00313EF044